MFWMPSVSLVHSTFQNFGLEWLRNNASTVIHICTSNFLPWILEQIEKWVWWVFFENSRDEKTSKTIIIQKSYLWRVCWRLVGIEPLSRVTATSKWVTNNSEIWNHRVCRFVAGAGKKTVNNKLRKMQNNVQNEVNFVKDGFYSNLINDV